MLTNKSCSPEEVTIATVVCFMFSIRIHTRQYAKHTLLVDYYNRCHKCNHKFTQIKLKSTLFLIIWFYKLLLYGLTKKCFHVRTSC